MTRKNNYLKTLIKSSMLTLVLLTLVIIAVSLMGVVYSEMEFTAFGRNVSFLEAVEKDRLSIFGKEFYFPLETAVENLEYYIESYSPGIIKLLGYAVNTLEELSKNIFKS